VTGLYNDIGDKKAVEKTSQALRDGAASLRKQLSEDLGDPDFLSAVFEMDVSAKTSTSLKDKDKPTKTKAVKKGHRRTKSNPDGLSRAGRKSLSRKMKAADVPGTPGRKSGRHPLSPPRSQPASPRIIRGSASFDQLYADRVDSSSVAAAEGQSRSMLYSGYGQSFQESLVLQSLMRSPSFELSWQPYETQRSSPLAMQWQQQSPTRLSQRALSPTSSQPPLSPSSGHPPLSPTSSHPPLSPASSYPPPTSPRSDTFVRKQPSPIGSPLPPGRHQFSGNAYEYSQSFQMSPIRRTWSSGPYHTSRRQSPQALPGWSSPMSFTGYSNGELAVPALSRDKPLTTQSVPTSPVGGLSRQSSGSWSFRTSPVMNSPRSFDPPLSPCSIRSSQRISSPRELKAKDYPDEAPSAVTVTSSNQVSEESRTEESRIVLKLESGSQSPTVVVNSVIDNEGKPEVEAVLSDPYANEGDWTISGDSNWDVNPAKDPSWDDDDDSPTEESDVSMSPLAFDQADPEALMEISDDLLKLPIAPCGPHDGNSDAS